jgi:ubiquinone/menaquinone biosynthesis C-methylase UbiE
MVHYTGVKSYINGARMTADLITFFDHLAARWDAMQSPERSAYLARLLEPHAAIFAGAARVLDVGSGTGAFLPLLDRFASGARVTALDLSGVMLARARAKNGQAVSGWLRGDGHDLPLVGGRFDLVTCHDCFAHFEDRARALAEFRRVLVPGGRLLILHDVSRAQVNTIHGSATHPRVQTHLLPPIAATAALARAAGFTILAAEDAADHYLLAARVPD